jgi:enoyl-CoA hydratase/carnithine racemase
MVGSVDLAHDGAIATVTLSNPGKLNALTTTMWRELGSVFSGLSESNETRCVIIRGAGDAFAAGADISVFETERRDAAAAKVYANTTVSALHALSHCKHPVLAQIKGACVGGGLEIASACDMRIAAASSKFGIPVKKLGLVVGQSELKDLLRVVSPAVALEIVLEGRIFGAAEAERKGLINRIVADEELEKEVRDTAERIAEGAPLVARWHKRFIQRLLNPAPLTETESDEFFACFDTQDFRTGYAAFLAKKKPIFAGQ